MADPVRLEDLEQQGGKLYATKNMDTKMAVRHAMRPDTTQRKQYPTRRPVE